MTLLLNTLYITTPETHLYKENETVVVKINREKRLQVPIHHLQAIVILGTAYVSPDLSRMCLERHVAITFLSERGRFLGRMEGPDASGAWLRRNQMEAHLDETRSLAIAKTLVKGKLANQRHVVQRAAREANEEEARELTDISARIEMIQKQVDRMETHDQVRGCEGEAAARYFEGFPFMVRQQRGDFPWGGEPTPAQGCHECPSLLLVCASHGRLPGCLSVRGPRPRPRISPRLPSGASCPGP